MVYLWKSERERAAGAGAAKKRIAQDTHKNTDFLSCCQAKKAASGIDVADM